ncbi:CDP-alcohol phosphatidyltransferase [Mucilaginibacter sp. PPCGB 2223]|uniref:CDP-alcohol phosphatidyltransferase family protein n=1 Tax=Mucilaginibacter sp. PPCGB 2223 TaxID=1886027 RepID=UPI000826241C|nr:CDP-alcohol phosphatidyltransferase family protein [Mucilaginibacter sp. PPCGB 2223]OCX53499.1 CDP-alcohol phosphatidyltransferase [Mucilaginibacter sp. PPCGB 2223]
MKNIPIALICSRLLFGVIIVLLAMLQPQYFQGVITVLIAIGFAGDILDGIIARYLKISTTKLRRMDSNVDMVFWICIIISSVIICPAFYKQNYWPVVILVLLEVTCYVLCFLRFKKEVATHALSAKAWAISIFVTLVLIINTSSPLPVFRICFYLGVISRLEIIAMLVVIKTWTNDIPTLYHAFKIRKGKPVKRYKLFNG